MRIDDKITGKRIKARLCDKRNVFAVAVIVALAAIMLFTLQNINTRSITVWETGKLSDCYMTPESERALMAICERAGVDFSLLIRSPEDNYYDAAFTTSGVYVSDILLLSGAEMERYKADGIFRDLRGMALDGNDGFYHGDELLGIKIDNDKYLTVNVRSDIDDGLLFEAARMIYEG